MWTYDKSQLIKIMEFNWNYDYYNCFSYMEKLSRLMRYYVLGNNIIKYSFWFSISCNK